jgi:hypothetical protein
MSNTILLKRSGTANSVPVSGSLAQGELALNFADGILYYKNSANTVAVLASSNANIVTNQIVNGTSNVLVYANANVTTTVAGLANVVVASINGLDVLGRVSATGTVTAATVSATGNVVAGSYLIGDGSLITNLSAANIATQAVANGTSNVSIPVASGNINMGRDGVNNTVVVSEGYVQVKGSFGTNKTLDSDVTVAANTNGVLFGTTTLLFGTNYFIPDDSTVIVLTGNA